MSVLSRIAIPINNESILSAEPFRSFFASNPRRDGPEARISKEALCASDSERIEKAIVFHTRHASDDTRRCSSKKHSVEVVLATGALSSEALDCFLHTFSESFFELLDSLLGCSECALDGLLVVRTIHEARSATCDSLLDEHHVWDFVEILTESAEFYDERTYSEAADLLRSANIPLPGGFSDLESSSSSWMDDEYSSCEDCEPPRKLTRGPDA